MPFFTRLLSLCPRIRKEEECLVASTPWWLRLLTLGTFFRKVIVDPDRKEVIIRRRYFWLFARECRIPFDAVQGVTYGYEDVSPFASWSWAHDSADLFRVGLKLDRLDTVHLFSFFGDGTFTNDGPLPNWFYWDDFLFDLSGGQEHESRAYAEVLSKMVKAPIQPS
jgi:hypothetical protein